MNKICPRCGIVTNFIYLLPSGEKVIACSAQHVEVEGAELVEWDKYEGEEFRGRSLGKMMIDEGVVDGDKSVI